MLFIAGEGAPDYAALYMNRTVKPLPFPEPIPSLTPFKLDPNTGYVLKVYNVIMSSTARAMYAYMCMAFSQVSIQK